MRVLVVPMKMQGQARKGVRNTPERGRFRWLLTHRCGPGAPSMAAFSAFLWGCWYGGALSWGLLWRDVVDPLHREAV